MRVSERPKNKPGLRLGASVRLALGRLRYGPCLTVLKFIALSGLGFIRSGALSLRRNLLISH